MMFTGEMNLPYVSSNICTQQSIYRADGPDNAATRFWRYPKLMFFGGERKFKY